MMLDLSLVLLTSTLWGRSQMVVPSQPTLWHAIPLEVCSFRQTTYLQHLSWRRLYTGPPFFERKLELRRCSTNPCVERALLACMTCMLPSVGFIVTMSLNAVHLRWSLLMREHTTSGRHNLPSASAAVCRRSGVLFHTFLDPFPGSKIVATSLCLSASLLCLV